MAKMENFNGKIEKIAERLKLLENFISLSMRRKERMPEIRKLQQDANEVTKLLEKTKFKVEHANIGYRFAMVRLQKTQLAIMEYVIAEKRRKIREADEEAGDIQKFTLSVKKENATTISNDYNLSSTLVANMAQLSINKQYLTPKMTIQDYKESPFVKRNRLNPISINFLEFDYQITPKTFESIPKYLRGREQIDELNSFLENTIIACFNDKYQLMHRNRDIVRNIADKELWIMYNEQASYLPGRHFITVGDISRKIGRIVDKKSLNRLAMLRHIGVLQEQRVKQIVCYAWVANTVF